MYPKFYEIIVSDNRGEKTILMMTLDDRVKHIYTTKLTSDRLSDKHPVEYGERISRVLSRLSAKDDTEIYRINLEDVLLHAYIANRTSVAVSILKKLRSYRRREEDLKNVKESAQA